MRKLLYIHGAGTPRPDPKSGLLEPQDYLREELGELFDISFPAMPQPDEPDAELWSKAIAAELDTLDRNDLVLGHSLGGSMVLKVIAVARPDIELAALVTLNAPYWGDEGWNYPEYGPPPGVADVLTGIRTVLLCQSSADEEVEAEHLSYYAREMPEAETLVIEGADHCLTKGDREALVARLKSL